MELIFLNDQNIRYTKNENINIAFNLYIARIADMNAMTLDEMKGK